MPALLGVTPELPLISYNNDGVTTFDAETGLLTIDASPTVFVDNAPTPTVRLFSTGEPRDFLIKVTVGGVGPDGTLNVSGVVGPDLTVIGSLDLDGDGSVDVSGVLLTGEVQAAGFAETGASDSFDFRFTLTGGDPLISPLFAGKDLVVTTISEDSSFAGSFAADFAGEAKGTLGTAPRTTPEPASLGNYVFEDVNVNGIQDVVDLPVAGVSVTLTGGGPDGVIGTGNDDTTATTTTDADGLYRFDGLTPGVEYKVTFALPSGFVSFTIPNVPGDDAIDSDAAPATGMSQVVILSPGEFNGTLDAGLLRPVTVGDLVWKDLDADGIQDGNEPGIPGVTLTLTGTDALGNAVTRTATTNALGRYLFNGQTLLPGTYTVAVGASNFAAGGPLAGLVASPTLVGTDRAIDSNPSPTGTTPTALPSGAMDLNLDFGFYAPVTGSIRVEKYVKAIDKADCKLQGLTPGFWKQSQHFAYWTGFKPTDRYNDVFGVADAYPETSKVDNPTLLEALQAGGGGSIAMARQAVASLLNAANTRINFAFSLNEVIGLVQNAYDSRSYEPTKNLLDAENNREGVDKKVLKTNQAFSPSTVSLGSDADTPGGPTIRVGDGVVFTYVVTNPGTVPLKGVNLVDDNGTAKLSDDFKPTPILAGTYNVGDLDKDGALDPGENWYYVASTEAACGLQKNTAIVTGSPIGSTSTVSDSDVAYYTGKGSKPIPNRDCFKDFWDKDCDKGWDFWDKDCDKGWDFWDKDCDKDDRNWGIDCDKDDRNWGKKDDDRGRDDYGKDWGKDEHDWGKKGGNKGGKRC